MAGTDIGVVFEATNCFGSVRQLNAERASWSRTRTLGFTPLPLPAAPTLPTRVNAIIDFLFTFKNP